MIFNADCVVNFCPVLLQKLHSARQRVKVLQALRDQPSKRSISVAGHHDPWKKVLGFAEELLLATAGKIFLVSGRGFSPACLALRFEWVAQVSRLRPGCFGRGNS